MFLKRKKELLFLRNFSKLVDEHWHSFLFACLIYSGYYGFILWGIVLNSVSSLDLEGDEKYLLFEPEVSIYCYYPHYKYAEMENERALTTCSHYTVGGRAKI